MEINEGGGFEHCQHFNDMDHFLLNKHHIPVPKSHYFTSGSSTRPHYIFPCSIDLFKVHVNGMHLVFRGFNGFIKMAWS